MLPDINEAKILAAANQFVSLGLKTVGYEYVNIDVSCGIMILSFCNTNRGPM